MKRLMTRKLSKKMGIVIAVVVLSLSLIPVAVLIAARDTKPAETRTENPDTAVPPKQTEEPPTTEMPPEGEEEPVAENPQVPVSEEPQWPILYSLQEAARIDIVVNKKHKLPSSYVPSLTDVSGGKLRPEAANELSTMVSDAKKVGVTLRLISSYRSYDTQVATYQKWVNTYGQAEADRISARPGHSEHQTGLAADIGGEDAACDLEVCFETTAAGKWLAANSSTYGYIIRYPADKEAQTGYSYEPWHIRYVGRTAAAAITSSGMTMDQYYGVTAGGYE